MLTVIAGSSVFIGGIALVSNFLRNVPSPYEACTRKCAAQSKSGQLIYRGPATPKSAYKDAFSECECR